MGKTITLLGHAKVNLALDITGQRPDGYHMMDMINRSVDLSDRLTIKKSKGREHTLLLGAKIRDDPHNTVLRAADRVARFLETDLHPMDFEMDKKIPAMAGLGGGSADAAAAIVGINNLLELKLTDSQLQQIGLSVGADVPFCIKGGAARVKGIGEVIRPIEDACQYIMVIVKPYRKRSTAEAFRELDKGNLCHPDVQLAEKYLTAGDLAGLSGCIGNAFFNPVTDTQTGELLDRLKREGALGASMSGSGSAVFGLYQDPELAAVCVENFRKDNVLAFVSNPLDCGVSIK